jgi:cellulose synthase (UDP-forming)
MTPAYCRREARIASLSLLLTIGLYFWLADVLAHKVYDSYFFPHSGPFYGGLVYFAALSIIFYSVIHYHICLIGNYKRSKQEEVPALETVLTLYDHVAPAVTILIPSYKEERQTILYTMLSAALSEYPFKNVVLLIDNPQDPKDPADKNLLNCARDVPQELQKQFVQQADIFDEARHAYHSRKKSGISNIPHDMDILAGLYDCAAQWLEDQAQCLMDGESQESIAGDVRFFIDTILFQPAQLYRTQAVVLRQSVMLEEIEIIRHYNRLAGLFNVRFSSFERKRYSNLSHDPNKAMNLNSYIMLIGRTWREVETPQGLQLLECKSGQEGFSIPGADYVNTIDADSLMTHDYIARLVYFLQQPKHSRVAVAQSPCSATPCYRSEVERIANASIDVQFHTHQGYTYWDASFWVGANAMLRMNALNAIKEVNIVDGKEIAVYIQDRTLIEDTESTIDLVDKGWKLYNYPKRMTFSPSPPDFGALLIQRRRWANGGLIILPKLLRYVFRTSKDLRLARELFIRFNYLAMTSLSVALVLVFCFCTFSPRLNTPLLIYANLPYLLLFSRDLKNCNYRYTDALRVCAFNLMLFPIIAAGVLKQLEQIITRRKLPFGRTPKVKGRTGAPALYYLLELALIGYFAHRVFEETVNKNWSQVVFAGINFLFLAYALIYFIGIIPLIEDLKAALSQLFKQLKSLIDGMKEKKN